MRITVRDQREEIVQVKDIDFFQDIRVQKIFELQTQREEIKVFVPANPGIHCEDANNRAKKPSPVSKWDAYQQIPPFRFWGGSANVKSHIG
jgi:hypothetical protein